MISRLLQILRGLVHRSLIVYLLHHKYIHVWTIKSSLMIFENSSYFGSHQFIKLIFNNRLYRALHLYGTEVHISVNHDGVTNKWLSHLILSSRVFHQSKTNQLLSLIIDPRFDIVGHLHYRQNSNTTGMTELSGWGSLEWCCQLHHLSIYARNMFEEKIVFFVKLSKWYLVVAFCGKTP